MNYLLEESQKSRNVRFIEQDARNYVHTKIEFSIEDSQRFLDYLYEMQIKSPFLFYPIHYDMNGKLTNIFWSYAGYMMDYSYFSDVVCFDLTYGTNEYEMLFGPIIEVNNHL